MASSSMHDRLKENRDKLVEDYNAKRGSTAEILKIAVEQILPKVAQDLNVPKDSQLYKDNEKYLSDDKFVYMFYRRNKYLRKETEEYIAKNLKWRMTVLDDALTQRLPKFAHVLPRHVVDPYGRPVMLLKISDLNGGTPPYFKEQLMKMMEMLIRNIGVLNSDGRSPPVFQYVIIVDLSGTAAGGIDFDLMRWTARDLIPKFPSLLGAIMVINYSWSHSTAWSLGKSVLPSASLSRIFFLPPAEIKSFMTRKYLPTDYGGALGYLEDLENPIAVDEPREESSQVVVKLPVSQTAVTQQHKPPQYHIPVISTIQPYVSSVFSFIYSTLPLPITRQRYSVGSQIVEYNRRSRRTTVSLVKLLATLWWEKWGTPMSVIAWLLVVVGAAKTYQRKRITFVKSGGSVWKELWN